MVKVLGATEVMHTQSFQIVQLSGEDVFLAKIRKVYVTLS